MLAMACLQIKNACLQTAFILLHIKLEGSLLFIDFCTHYLSKQKILYEKKNHHFTKHPLY